MTTPPTGTESLLQAPAPPAGPEWLGRLRAEAEGRFAGRGMPTSDDEAWRFTSLAALSRTAFTTAAADTAAPLPADTGHLLDLEAGARLVFVDGHFDAARSRRAAAGVVLLTLQEALDACPELLQSHLGRGAGGPTPFADLNTSRFTDAAIVRIDRDAVIPEPLTLVFLSSGAAAHDSGRVPAAHPRVLVVAGPRSRATLVELHAGPGGRRYLTSPVTELVLGEGAHLEHHRVQREGTDAYHLASVAVRQGAHSRYRNLNLAAGAALSRIDIDQLFEGEGAECVLDGLFIGAGSQHTDVHTKIDHAQPHCASRELYKGILDGQARGVFHGTVVVRKGAQKTDAQQTNRNLLLSREALVNSTPALEIFADDVRCKHGSTTGQLDPRALFYLRSRGLAEAEARRVLTCAFAGEIVGRVRSPLLRQAVAGDLQQCLGGDVLALQESFA